MLHIEIQLLGIRVNAYGVVPTRPFCVVETQNPWTLLSDDGHEFGPVHAVVTECHGDARTKLLLWRIGIDHWEETEKRVVFYRIYRHPHVVDIVGFR